MTTDGPAEPSSDGNSALVALRDALLEEEAPSVARWADVCARAGACKAQGLAVVAGDYLAARMPAWGEPWSRGPCPCGDWVRWLRHHLPDDAEARRDALRSMRCAPREVGCAPRVMLRAVGSAPGGDALLLGCSALLWVAAPRWPRSAPWLCAGREGEEAPPKAPRWRYRWDVDADEATLEPVGGATLWQLGADGARVERSRVVLRPGVALDLGGVQVEVPPEGLPRVLVVRHPDDEGVRRHMIVSPEVTVGRHPDSQVRIVRRRMAQRHCLLFWSDGAWHVRDLHTANGTYVNGVRVQGRGQRVEPGDAVQVADVAFVFPAWAGGARL